MKLLINLHETSAEQQALALPCQFLHEINPYLLSNVCRKKNLINMINQHKNLLDATLLFFFMRYQY